MDAIFRFAPTKFLSGLWALVAHLVAVQADVDLQDGGGEVLSVSYFPGDSPAHKTPKPNQNLRSETLEGKLKFVKQLAAPTSYGDNKDS